MHSQIQQIRKFAAVVAVPSLLVLAACGGESGRSGGDAGNDPTTDTGTLPPAYPTGPVAGAAIVAVIGGDPLSAPEQEIAESVARIGRVVDAYLETDGIETNGERAQTTCNGIECTSNGYSFTPFEDPLSVQEIMEEWKLVPIMTRRGVQVFETYGTDTTTICAVDGSCTSTEDAARSGYGGWLRFNSFSVEAYIDRDEQTVAPDGTMTSLGLNVYTYGNSWGQTTGTTPVNGSASWRGVMVSSDVSAKERALGDATLTADFASSEIDVAFTNIHEVATAADRPDFGFLNVPMNNDGFARHVGDGNRIEGKFYGAGHAEAGGIFERGSMVGAFGAKRQ